MSLTLILIRHAKSDWGDPSLPDHDRPLNMRGLAAAPLIGGWLNEKGFTPDSVLCSTARRTQETWSGIATQLNAAPAPDLSRALYHAEPSDILQALRSCEGRKVAVIGHNPGIGALAWSLVATPPDHPSFGSYPTGACLVLEFQAETWAEITEGTGHLQGFVTPRDLSNPT